MPCPCLRRSVALSYETIAFKVPNIEVDKSEGKFQTDWDSESKTFSVQMFFKQQPTSAPVGVGGSRPPPPGVGQS